MSSVRDWAFLRMRTELTSKRILLIFDELSPVRGWTFSKNEKRKTLVFLGLTQSHIRHAFSPRGQCEAGCAAQVRPFRPLITTAVCYQCKGQGPFHLRENSLFNCFLCVKVYLPSIHSFWLLESKHSPTVHQTVSGIPETADRWASL